MDCAGGGGYGEDSGVRWRRPGWSESYECTREGEALHLKADLDNGLRFERTYTVAAQGGASLTIESVLTNVSDGAREALIRANPALDPREWDATSVRIHRADGPWEGQAPGQAPATATWRARCRLR